MTKLSGAHGGRGDRSRALVLGAGGPVGRAWEAGLMAGFADQGIDLATADLIIGTSAGAVIGAQLALKQGFAAPAKPEAIASGPPPLPSAGMAEMAAAMARAARSPEPEPIRAEIGRMALAARTVSEEASLSRSMFAPFVGQAWPSQFRATAVNARTGQLRIWDASSGASLERALAASTAIPGVWPPITIDGERYIDGGIGGMLNADLAGGSCIVIAVSCFSLTHRGNAGAPFLTAMSAASLAELDALRASGAAVAMVEPHSEFLALTRHGIAMMDIGLIPEAYRLGHVAAAGEAEQLRRIWKPR